MPANLHATTRRAVLACAASIPFSANAGGRSGGGADSPALAAFRRWREAADAFASAGDRADAVAASLPPRPAVNAMGRDFHTLEAFDAAAAQLKAEPGMDADTAARMRAKVIAAAEGIKAEPPPYEAQREEIEAARVELQRAISERQAADTYAGARAILKASDEAFQAMQGPACDIEYMQPGDPNAASVMVAYLIRQGIDGAYDPDDFAGSFIRRLARVMLPAMPADVAGMVRADLAQLDAERPARFDRARCRARQDMAAAGILPTGEGRE